MAQLVKCLINKNGDLNSGPQHPCENAYNPSAGRSTQENPTILLASQLAILLNFRFNGSTCLTKGGECWKPAQNIDPSLYLHMLTCMCPIHAHTCKHVHTKYIHINVNVAFFR